jgi:hypothetical protein
MIGNITGTGKMESGGQKHLLSLTFNTDNRLKIFIEVDTTNITSVSSLTDYVINKGLTTYYDGDGTNETEKVIPTLTIPVPDVYSSVFAIPLMIRVTKTGTTTWSNLTVILMSNASHQGMTISEQNWSLAYE